MKSIFQRSGFIFLAYLAACSGALKKPCSTSGDLSWDPPVNTGGDHYCEQKKVEGKFVNHGMYEILYPNGKVALQGEFWYGKKQGVWTQFDESGKKMKMRYFEQGVEKPLVIPE